jgi:hypothetical protein
METDSASLHRLINIFIQELISPHYALSLKMPHLFQDLSA